MLSRAASSSAPKHCIARGHGFDWVNGGSTEWLTTSAPVAPDEVVMLDLTVFDVGNPLS
jgi:hypothetical protein